MDKPSKALLHSGLGLSSWRVARTKTRRWSALQLRDGHPGHATSGLCFRSAHTIPDVAQPPARRSGQPAPPAAWPCLTENPANHQGRPQWPDFRPGRWGPTEASVGLEGQLEALRRASSLKWGNATQYAEEGDKQFPYTPSELKPPNSLGEHTPFPRIIIIIK